MGLHGKVMDYHLTHRIDLLCSTAQRSYTFANISFDSTLPSILHSCDLEPKRYVPLYYVTRLNYALDYALTHLIIAGRVAEI